VGIVVFSGIFKRRLTVDTNRRTRSERVHRRASLEPPEICFSNGPAKLQEFPELAKITPELLPAGPHGQIEDFGGIVVDFITEHPTEVDKAPKAFRSDGVRCRQRNIEAFLIIQDPSSQRQRGSCASGAPISNLSNCMIVFPKRGFELCHRVRVYGTISMGSEVGVQFWIVKELGL
jgi:hypothetical protein